MLAELKSELNPKRMLFVSLSSALIAAIDIPQIISLSVILFAGGMQNYVILGIGFGIFGALIAQTYNFFFGSHQGILVGPQDAPTAILSVIALSVAALAIPEEEKFATILAMVMITTFATGLLFLFAGWFNLSKLVRLIPYPVLGGFIAGTGLLLTIGGLGITTNAPIELDKLSRLFFPDLLPRWVPGILLAVALLTASLRSKNIFITPVILLTSIALFYGSLLLSGNTFGQIQSAGWLLGPFPQGAIWKPIDLSIFTRVNWEILLDNAGGIIVAVFISLVGMTLNLSALELVAKKDMDQKKELISIGVVNMVASLIGSNPIYHYLGLSSLAFHIKANGRLLSLFLIIILASILFFGAGLLSLTPRFVVGGLLVYLGLAFLYEWIYEGWFKLPRLEYLLTVFILVVVGWFGFLEGVAVGILGAVLLFAINYGQVDIVKDALTGSSYRSNVERPIAQYQSLQEMGSKILALRLQGYIFFGSVQSLVDQIRARISDEKTKPEYIILDFKNVTSLDTSAVVGLTRILQMTAEKNIKLIFSSVSKANARILQRGNFEIEGDNASARIFMDMDYAMEFCENQILMQDAASAVIAPSFKSQIKRYFTPQQTERIMNYMEKKNLGEFHILIQIDTPPDSMYFIESGELAAHIEVSKGKFTRLRSMGPGAVVGEVGHYLNGKRTATVSVVKESVVYQLTRDSVTKMETEDTELAIRFHIWMSTLLSLKLSDNNRTIEALTK